MTTRIHIIALLALISFLFGVGQIRADNSSINLSIELEKAEMMLDKLVGKRKFILINLELKNDEFREYLTVTSSHNYCGFVSCFGSIMLENINGDFRVVFSGVIHSLKIGNDGQNGYSDLIVRIGMRTETYSYNGTGYVHNSGKKNTHGMKANDSNISKFLRRGIFE